MSTSRVLPLAPDYRQLRLDEASRRKGLNTGPGIARRFGASGRAELAPAWQADTAPMHEIHARNLPHEKQSGGRLHIPRPSCGNYEIDAITDEPYEDPPNVRFGNPPYSDSISLAARLSARAK